MFDMVLCGSFSVHFFGLGSFVVIFPAPRRSCYRFASRVPSGFSSLFAFIGLRLFLSLVSPFLLFVHAISHLDGVFASFSSLLYVLPCGTGHGYFTCL